MKLRHPFEWITISAQTPTFIVLLIITLVLMLSLNLLGVPLKTEFAPAGIISYEFAGELSTAQRIVESWGEVGRVYAGLNLGLDCLFLVAYPIAIGLGCVMLSRRLSERIAFLSTAGLLLAWGQVAAGLFDSLENYALIRVLLGTETSLWPVVARWCAIPKFTFVILGLVYVPVGLVALFMARDRGGLHAA